MRSGAAHRVAFAYWLSFRTFSVEDPSRRPHREGGARAQPAKPGARLRPRDPCGAARACGTSSPRLFFFPICLWCRRSRGLPEGFAGSGKSSSNSGAGERLDVGTAGVSESGHGDGRTRTPFPLAMSCVANAGAGHSKSRNARAPRSVDRWCQLISLSAIG